VEVVVDGHLYSQSLAMQAGFQCAGCGEWNDTTVDESAGRTQSYIEDCQVCCKPNVLQISYDPEVEQFYIMAELE
jgi:cysteine-rich CPXCG protein